MTSAPTHPTAPASAPAIGGHSGDAGVIISGGGPAGLCLAVLLSEQHIPVTVLEAENGILRDLRASTFHPPTLDMLDRLGISDGLVREDIPCPNWQIRLQALTRDREQLYDYMLETSMIEGLRQAAAIV